MTFLSLLTFFLTMFLIVLLPGPGTFAITAKSLSHNLTSVSFIVFGMVIADIIFLLFAIFGLSAIASLLGELFIIVKYLGALYLIYLGYKLLTSKENKEQMQTLQATSQKKNFLLGFAITFSNPKVILFYLSLLPTLVNIHALTFFDITLLMLTVSIVITTVMFGYALITLKAKRLFKSTNATKKMNKFAGGVMLSAGGFLLIKG